jgi:hypothetical protein
MLTQMKVTMLHGSNAFVQCNINAALTGAYSDSRA